MQKEFILSKQKITDDIVRLISVESVALRSGVTINLDGTFRVVGTAKKGQRILATELSANSLTIIETTNDNLLLVSRNEKKFRKVFEIITKARHEKRLAAAQDLWND